MGTTPAPADLGLAEDLHRELAELRVQLMDERDTTRSLQATITTSNEDLTAAHEVARDYLRELNQTREELQRAHQKLTGLRIRAVPPANGEGDVR